ncbi:MAG: tRNA (adenosine(37)-N6)-threonylcarbamoyltransferase complex ATPase subunit type 1 TsaE [Candidatus Omnitrophota bacterium]
MQIITKNAQQTINFGKRIAKLFKKGDVIALFGNLGAGKTTLVKGIAKGFGLSQNSVNSPSFVLLKAYKGKMPLYHFDFYRIKNPDEAHNIGLEEFLFSDGVSVIEWAERIRKFLPEECLHIEFKFINENQRKIKLTGKNKYYKDLIKRL